MDYNRNSTSLWNVVLSGCCARPYGRSTPFAPEMDQHPAQHFTSYRQRLMVALCEGMSGFRPPQSTSIPPARGGVSSSLAGLVWGPVIIALTRPTTMDKVRPLRAPMAPVWLEDRTTGPPPALRPSSVLGSLCVFGTTPMATLRRASACQAGAPDEFARTFDAGEPGSKPWRAAAAGPSDPVGLQSNSPSSAAQGPSGACFPGNKPQLNYFTGNAGQAILRPLQRSRFVLRWWSSAYGYHGNSQPGLRKAPPSTASELSEQAARRIRRRETHFVYALEKNRMQPFFPRKVQRFPIEGRGGRTDQRALPCPQKRRSPAKPKMPVWQRFVPHRPTSS